MEKLDRILMNLMATLTAIVIPLAVVVYYFVPELKIPLLVVSIVYLAALCFNRLADLFKSFTKKNEPTNNEEAEQARERIIQGLRDLANRIEEDSNNDTGNNN